MKKDNSISNLTRSQGKLYQQSGGSILVNVIIIIVIFASIISAVVYMSSSSLRQAVSSNQGANAWSMAEAGYRFLSINYMKTTNTSNNATADYDKAVFLGSVNGRTYVIPNVGSFTLTVTPYWFYNTAAANASGKIISISVKFAGTVPSGLTTATMPSTGQIKIGDTPGSGITPYTNGSLNTATAVFTCKTNSAASLTLKKGDSVYLVLNPTTTPTNNANKNLLAPGNNLNLNLVNFPAAAFPARDGLIEINPNADAHLYRYSKATVSGSVLTLNNLQRSDGSTTFSTAVTTASTVTFKKYLMAQSQGKVANEQRTLSFSQAILDSIASTAVSLSLNTAAELTANFNNSASITSETASLTVSGGGSATFSIIDSLPGTGTAPRCGAFWYNNTSLINTLWGPPPVGTGLSLLSYDLQVKMASGKYLTAGTLGLAIRAKNIGTPTETYLGLTFMKYNLANLNFTAGGPTVINPGNSLVGATSGATGIVQGTPEITSGSWAAGTAAGKIRFASVTGTFTNNELLKVGTINVAKNTPANGGTTYYTAAAADNIPDAIKPRPSDFSPANYNIGPLLLVLWEKKSDGTFRWLAFKDITYDDYVKGSQDWSEPDGSCTGTCPENDGVIINDSASLYIRIQEKRVVLVTGSDAVKVNDINLFYGDNSSRYITGRSGDAIPWNIENLRLRYVMGASTFTPVFVPEYIAQWSATVDYFSHIETGSGTPAGSNTQFQWDAVNPNVTDITVLKICNDGSAACTSSEDGTLRLTELVTPNYSTTTTATTAPTYLQPEFGLIACGNIRSPSNLDYATVGFAEIGFQTPASSYGGFTDTTQYW
jgi:hypothetical protein